MAQWTPPSLQQGGSLSHKLGPQRKTLNMHAKKIYCGSILCEHIQNKALDEALYRLSWINGNKYSALFGYKCTINTKIFTCISIIIWMIVIDWMHKQNYRHIVHYTNSGVGGLRGHLLHITAFIFHSKAKSENKKQPRDYFGLFLGLSFRETHTHTHTQTPLDSLAAVVFGHLQCNAGAASRRAPIERRADLTSETLAIEAALKQRVDPSRSIRSRSKRD